MWADVDTPRWWGKAALQRCGGGEGAGEETRAEASPACRVPVTDETAPLQDGTIPISS
jgi:hypothetical protein